MKKIFKKSSLSELVDELIESTARLFKVYDCIKKQEVIDTNDDERRANYRKRLDNKLGRLENQLFSGRIDEAKDTLIGLQRFEDHQREVEDKYEKLDDDFRDLNMVKLEDAIEELRSASNRFEQRHLEDMRDEKKGGK